MFWKDNRARVVIFIKKVNLHGANIRIKIPQNYKEIVIEGKCRNLERIKKIINAGNIFVI